MERRLYRHRSRPRAAIVLPSGSSREIFELRGRPRNAVRPRLRFPVFRPRQAQAHDRADAASTSTSPRSTRATCPYSTASTASTSAACSPTVSPRACWGAARSDDEERARRGVRAGRACRRRRATTSSATIPPTSPIDPVTGTAGATRAGRSFLGHRLRAARQPESRHLGARLRDLRYEREHSRRPRPSASASRSRSASSVSRSGPRLLTRATFNVRVPVHHRQHPAVARLQPGAADHRPHRGALRHALRHQCRELPGELHRRAAALVVRLLGTEPRRDPDPQPERSSRCRRSSPSPAWATRPAGCGSTEDRAGPRVPPECRGTRAASSGRAARRRRRRLRASIPLVSAPGGSSFGALRAPRAAYGRPYPEDA